MKLLLLLFFILSTFITVGSAQRPAEYAQTSGPPQRQTSFRPSVAVVVGIFSIIISLTFLLLIYARFCHSAAYGLFSRDPNPLPGGVFSLPPTRPEGGGAAARTPSGIDKSVIESLPFFRFSSLKGSRDGLECAVCLSKFDDAELLRLLPACKHAFHIGCVDRWLESHSTCPLCRHRIDPHDASLFTYSTSNRFLSNSRHNDHNSNNNEDRTNIVRDVELDLDIFVEREPSSRSFGLGTTKNKLELEDDRIMHNFKHRIIVTSDVVFKSRWSDLSPSDIMSLNSDMLNMVSSKRFEPAVGPPERQSRVAGGMLKIKEEMERKRALETKANEISRSFTADVESGEYNLMISSTCTPTRSLISPGRHRCMSEITNVSRFHGAKNATTTAAAAADEKVRRLWLPIARRTVQWLAGRERRSTEENVEHSNHV